MLFRDDLSGSIAIPQPSHAWLSGQIIRAWGNAEFGAVTPYEDVCLGAEQHDIGWLVWEQSPTLNKTTGRPHSFRELSIATHTAMWSQGTAMALALGRYPALLVSLHGTGLYAGFDAASAGPADAAIVREFLDGQQAVQRRLMNSLGTDEHLAAFSSPEMIERNRRLVRAADRISIAICTAMRDLAIRSDNPLVGIVKDVPTAAGEVDVRLVASGADQMSMVVAPWPFSAGTVRVACEGIALPPRPLDDENEMRLALRNGKTITISAELKPER